MHLELRREPKEDCTEVREAPRGWDSRTVQVTCSLEGGTALEGLCSEMGGHARTRRRGPFTWRHRNNGQGLPKAEIRHLLKKVYAWCVVTHHDQPGGEFMTRSPCEVFFL